MLLLAAAVPGCKKKEPAPSPQVSPLPKKPQQAQAPAPAAAVQSKVSTAKKPVALAPPAAPLIAQKQMSSATRIPAVGGISFDFSNRRDPFKPYAQAPLVPLSTGGKAGKAKAKVKVRDPLPIQSYDTEKFRVTGIITGLKENSALMVDPANKGYVVKAGMQIGNNDGYVKRVTDTAVEVEEPYTDEKGRTRKRLIKLSLIRKK